MISQYFYWELLPEVMRFYKNEEFKSKDMLFNWGDVEFVNALVIPNILMLGHQMRVLTEKKITIYILVCNDSKRAQHQQGYDFYG